MPPSPFTIIVIRVICINYFLFFCMFQRENKKNKNYVYNNIKSNENKLEWLLWLC
jgi:hypothetical protein